MGRYSREQKISRNDWARVVKWIEKVEKYLEKGCWTHKWLAQTLGMSESMVNYALRTNYDTWQMSKQTYKRICELCGMNPDEEISNWATIFNNTRSKKCFIAEETESETQMQLDLTEEPKAEPRKLVPLPEDFLKNVVKNAKTQQNVPDAFSYVLNKALESIKKSTDEEGKGYIEISFEEMKEKGFCVSIAQFRATMMNIMNLYAKIPDDEEEAKETEYIPIFSFCYWSDIGFDGYKQRGYTFISFSLSNRVLNDWEEQLKEERND